MEDIFEILIYILFIGASVIGGIYKNYVKKKEEEKRRQRMAETTHSTPEFGSEEAPTPTVTRTLEDFLREQFEVEMEPEVVEEYVPPVQEVSKPMPDEKLKTLHEGTAAFKQTDNAILSDNLNDPNFSITDYINAQEKNPIYENEISDADTGALSDLDEFDGAKAVIYSEILNRRHS